MSNELPTISIKGKDYVLVKDRINYFNETFDRGSIETEIISYENGQVVMKAIVCPVAGEDRIFVAHSQARENDGMVNKTAALENAETSAVGRALAMMGIGVIDSVASADELHKAGVVDPIAKVRLPQEKASTASPVTPGQEQLAQDVDDVLEPGIAESGAYCNIHDVMMKERQDFNGHYWDHRRQNDKGAWEQCNGVDGFKVQKKRE